MQSKHDRKSLILNTIYQHYELAANSVIYQGISYKTKSKVKISLIHVHVSLTDYVHVFVRENEIVRLDL